MRKAKLSVIGEWQMLINAFSLQDTIKIDRMSKVRHVKKLNTVQFHSKQKKIKCKQDILLHISDTKSFFKYFFLKA